MINEVGKIKLDVNKTLDFLNQRVLAGSKQRRY